MTNNKSNYRRIINWSILGGILFLFVLFAYRYGTYTDEIYQRNSLGSLYPKIEPSRMTQTLKEGEYLAKLGNCISCHTDNKAGSGVFAGGLMINTPYGKIPSTNITPDDKEGIGLWSKEDFIRAMKHGVSPKGENYYPAFPYLYFSNLTERDLNSLFQYFRSIPAIDKKNKSPDFPLNIWGARKLVSIWNMFGFKRKPNLLPAKNSIDLKIGAYIVNGVGHCGMCHTSNDVFGLPRVNYFLSGAFIGGFWAPNINRLGLGTIDNLELINVFKKGSLLNNAGPLAGPMADVSHNSLKFLTLEDANSIALYLKSVTSKPALSVTPTVSERVLPTYDRGEKVYMQVCLVCHQTGRASAPKIGNAGTWFSRINSSGLDGLYQRTINGFNNMPRLGGCVNCTKNDIISAVDYMLLKSLTPSQFKQMSKK